MEDRSSNILATGQAHNPAFRGGRAFTLVELVMCMAIMVIFGAIAAPRYSQAIAHYRIEMAGKRLSADLSWLRTLAKAQSTSQTVAFNTASSTYTFNNVNNPDNPSQIYAINLSNDPYKVAIYSDSFSNSTLTFDGYGTPSGSGTIVLTCGTWQKTLTVNADDGTVSSTASTLNTTSSSTSTTQASSS